jgi:S1-C subfamily serine protease
MKNATRRYFVLLFFLLAPWLALPCVAEIYKYQDEYGRWHFTDKAPLGKEAPKAKTEEKETTPPSRDLEAKLHEKYQPSTPIQKASLAVVAIHSPLVEGSGFFISDDGYILTNKHIVKPTETTQWQELQEKVAETDEAYKEANKELRSERARLNEMEETLKDYREEIDRADDSYAKRMAEAEYKMLKRRYMEYKREYLQVKKNYQLSKKEYEKARREFNIQSSYAILRKDFKVILKDDTEVTARMISVSDKSDLALLKIDRYHTPFIQPANRETLRQGMRVFAIGSPLGIKDVMTAGVVAGFKDEYVISDATILPGSSGGPLVTDAGEVAGINSIRVSQVVGGEGFGVAICIDTAFTEFSKYIKRK